MNALRALRLALLDIWEESTMVLGIGLLGALLSLLVLPLPFVLAGHYEAADRIAEERTVTWRSWLQSGWGHARFFAFWLLLVAVVAVVLAGNLLFYRRFDAWWAALMRGLTTSLLILWLLPQPLVPAFYFRQVDRRLRVALRNAAIVAIGDPFSIIILWLATFLLALPLAYVAVPLLPVVFVFVAFMSTRLVGLRVRQAGRQG
jgi:hypothetical protein